MKCKYKVTLENPKMSTSFDTDNKESTIEAFSDKKVLILNKPNGDVFAIRMEDYSTLNLVSEEST